MPNAKLSPEGLDSGHIVGTRGDLATIFQGLLSENQPESLLKDSSSIGRRETAGGRLGFDR
jgi:hypothetical protein